MISVLHQGAAPFTVLKYLGAVHMSRASPANRADSILSRPVGA